MNNTYYKTKEIGEIINLRWRCLYGCSLTLLVLLVMFGPMLLFSTLDLIGTLNPVQENKMSLDLVFGNVRHKLFETSLMISNATLNQTEFYE